MGRAKRIWYLSPMRAAKVQASAQSRQNLRCSLIQAVSQEEPSDRKPDPWSLWMAGHAQLKFVMTECSKTQIRLTRPVWWVIRNKTVGQPNTKWAPSSEFVSSSIQSWQILTAHAQPFRGARDLVFCLKVPLDSLFVWASSGGSGETARMRRLAWTFAARIGDKYQTRLARPKLSLNHRKAYSERRKFWHFCDFDFQFSSVKLRAPGLNKIYNLVWDTCQFKFRPIIPNMVTWEKNVNSNPVRQSIRKQPTCTPLVLSQNFIICSIYF